MAKSVYICKLILATPAAPKVTLGAIQSHFGYHGFHFVALGQPCWGRGNPQKATESTPRYKEPKTRFLSLSVGTLLGHLGGQVDPQSGQVDPQSDQVDPQSCQVDPQSGQVPPQYGNARGGKISLHM